MNTHVFIVDQTTFKTHLEFLFAGTGAKDNIIDFNASSNPDLRFIENTLAGLIADGNRIRKDDKIIFYLLQNYGEKIFEGKFYGIFRANHNGCFLDNNTEGQYLREVLKKSLTFRTIIEPDDVYSEGVTEWEALDEIKNINSPNQMLWSLIYRKLKGNRGNTMITIYESERLCQLIRDKNNRKPLYVNNNKLTFDAISQKIQVTSMPVNKYEGRKETINILPRLIEKYINGKAFESLLQAYITQNIGLNVNYSLDSAILKPDNSIEWIGNEVSCGVGMQRIDVMLSEIYNNQKNIIPIELKAVEISPENVIQIKRYIDWIEQYYKPNRQGDITPVIIAKIPKNIHTQSYITAINNFKIFNKENEERCNPIKYIEYTIENNDLEFKVKDY